MPKLSNMSEFRVSSFITKAGKLVETKPHYASFNHKHNAAKSKVLIVLYHRRFNVNDNTGMGIGELHRATGANYGYLTVKVTKWCQWQYISRAVRAGERGRPIYVYSLAKRGQHFIEDVLPPEWLKQYIIDIHNFKKKDVN